ncbi:MAG: type II toxin-antitoxin system RelE/ParE family toxin [Verrucomicrobiales bacterium]|nr:type II toxin-antitoxin system RelE/ParE family toxin [Verrucomicrobiales bacterium]
MIFVRSVRFERGCRGVLEEEDLVALELALVAKPDAGKLIKNGDGLRKLRWGASGRGKRGGARVIYYWWTADRRILLLDVYTKNEKEDLSGDELKKLKKEIVQ